GSGITCCGGLFANFDLDGDVSAPVRTGHLDQNGTLQISVPEPGMAALTLVGWAALMARRRVRTRRGLAGTCRPATRDETQSRRASCRRSRGSAAQRLLGTHNTA